MNGNTHPWKTREVSNLTACVDERLPLPRWDATRGPGIDTMTGRNIGLGYICIFREFGCCLWLTVCVHCTAIQGLSLVAAMSVCATIVITSFAKFSP